jgi:hypothetical protein
MGNEPKDPVENALDQAAKYMHLFEEHSDGLPVHSANIYQFFATEMQLAANDRAQLPRVRELARKYPTIRDLMENTVVSDMLESNRYANCPTLFALLRRLMHKETR